MNATLLLIRYCLLPVMTAKPPLPVADGGITRIPPEAFAAQLVTLDACLRPDGRLALLFEGALAPAAPFLLYHLKRNGFSACQAVVVPDGIKLTARR